MADKEIRTTGNNSEECRMSSLQNRGKKAEEKEWKVCNIGDNKVCNSDMLCLLGAVLSSHELDIFNDSYGFRNSLYYWDVSK